MVFNQYVFKEIARYKCVHCFITGVNDTGDEFTAGVNNNGDKLMTVVNDAGDIF